MTKRKPLYTITHVLSSVLMLALLTWLTVCLPFVNQSQKASKAQTEQTSDDKSDGSNPLTNTNEEKSESGNSLLQEYLHEMAHMVQHVVTLTKSFKGHPSDLYIAYHPDLVIPPPEV